MLPDGVTPWQPRRRRDNWTHTDHQRHRSSDRIGDFSILSYSGLKARHPVSPWLAQRRRAKTAICFDAITLRHETTYMRSGRFAHKDAQKCFSSVARLRLNNRERCRFCACMAQLVTRSRHNADFTVRRFRNASATAPLFCLGGIPIDGRFSWHSPDNRECAKRLS